MAHVRQSAPDSSHGFEVSAPKTLTPFPFGSDTEAGMLRKLRLLEDPKKGVVLQVPSLYHPNFSQSRFAEVNSPTKSSTYP